ncbi:MAG: hypothetical protein AMS24_04485 [Chlamydiae bacterium SM23_39]|nr:MAG: hypothetical protein AMS24_04485 [Chlamydiae bacterium SM23_39]
MKKNISKIKEVKDFILSQNKPKIEEVSSNLLNFIVKSKREKSLKAKITKIPKKKSSKIIRTWKKFFKEKIIE